MVRGMECFQNRSANVFFTACFEAISINYSPDSVKRNFLRFRCGETGKERAKLWLFREISFFVNRGRAFIKHGGTVGKEQKKT